MCFDDGWKGFAQVLFAGVVRVISEGGDAVGLSFVGQEQCHSLKITVDATFGNADADRLDEGWHF